MATYCQSFMSDIYICPSRIIQNKVFGIRLCRNGETLLPGGTLPERVLFRISRTSSRGASASLEGIEPKRLLKLKSNLIKNLKSPKLAGIAPVR